MPLFHNEAAPPDDGEEDQDTGDLIPGVDEDALDRDDLDTDQVADPADPVSPFLS